MASITVTPASAELPFGARIAGVTPENVTDAGVRAQLNAAFEQHGVLVFEGVEPSIEMQVEVSKVFGPLRSHTYKGITTVKDGPPGVMELSRRPGEGDVFEVDGEPLTGWVPWHFDACYNNELNRAGVLRVIESPPKGGLTGFADGIQMYRDVSPALREKFEDLEILYHPKLMFVNMRYGRPRRIALRRLSDPTNNMYQVNAESPRAIHPAIWQRASGEKVLHLAPWQNDGILGHEDEEGDALLEAMIAEMKRVMKPYWHKWSPGELVIWDNWRLVHSASGHSPDVGRLVHRTTIEGDYGLGRWETEPEGAGAMEMAG